jgi:ribonuclease HI
MVVVSQARDMIANFHLVATQPSLDASPSIRLQSLWEKPPVGWLKTNWDAAISKEWKKAAFGVVVRNVEGGVVAASVTVVPFVTDPTSAEALGAWHSLSLCRRRGFNHVLLEGDSSVVVSAINNTLPCLSSYGQVIEDTRFCLQEVQPVEVQHVKREANQAPHLLAKDGLCVLNDCTWLGECPSPIQDIVAFEQAIIV